MSIGGRQAPMSGHDDVPSIVELQNQVLEQEVKYYKKYCRLLEEKFVSIGPAIAGGGLKVVQKIFDELKSKMEEDNPNQIPSRSKF